MTPPTAPRDACVYATSGWGIHDDRWMAALRTVGFRPEAISLGRDAPDAAALRRAVEAIAGTDAPVLAGPLHTVTRHLVGLPARVVGLSWGYDMAEVLAAGPAPSWLAGLDALIVDSEENRAIAERHGLAAEAVTYLPWGIDVSAFTPDGPRAHPGDFDLPDDARIVLSLRAHEPLYRVADVVEAFARAAAADSTLALVLGHSGSLTGELRGRVTALGMDDRVRYIGSIPEGDLPPMLRAAACYVTASSADGTSVTLLQAMACGTPVVASDTAGNLQWIVDGVTGTTFATGDVGSLAVAIGRATAGDTTRTTRAARAAVERRADWAANLPRLRRALTGAP